MITRSTSAPVCHAPPASRISVSKATMFALPVTVGMPTASSVKATWPSPSRPTAAHRAEPAMQHHGASSAPGRSEAKAWSSQARAGVSTSPRNRASACGALLPRGRNAVLPWTGVTDFIAGNENSERRLRADLAQCGGERRAVGREALRLRSRDVDSTRWRPSGSSTPVGRIGIAVFEAGRVQCLAQRRVGRSHDEQRMCGGQRVVPVAGQRQRRRCGCSRRARPRVRAPVPCVRRVPAARRTPRVHAAADDHGIQGTRLRAGHTP